MNIDTIILSGGGPSGLCYVGIIKALREKNILFIQKVLFQLKDQ